jgi:hypothetical protein
MVEHREFLSDLAGAVNFTSLQYPLNPGLGQTFPWLSTIAPRFESYRFDYLHLIFEPASSSMYVGTVILAVDFDASDPPPVSKTQVMSYRGAVRTAPWQECSCILTKEDLHKRSTYYVRNGGIPTGADVKLYDVGNWFACVQGQANTSLIGELYVEYRVRLMTPQMNSPGAGVAIGGTYAGTDHSALFTSSTGNISGVFSSVTFSGNQNALFTANQAWQGFVSAAFAGTGFIAEAMAIVSGQGTATFLNGIINSAGTDATMVYYVSLQPMAVLEITIENTTVADATASFGQSPSA